MSGQNLTIPIGSHCDSRLADVSVNRRCALYDAVKLLGPWFAFRFFWRPFIRYIQYVLTKSYGYRQCDAVVFSHYYALLFGVFALLLSLYLTGQFARLCYWYDDEYAVSGAVTNLKMGGGTVRTLGDNDVILQGGPKK